MRIAFVSPPELGPSNFVAAEDCCITATTGRLLPAGLLAMASEAKIAGHDVAYIDLSIDTKASLGSFDAVVFSLIWHYHSTVYKAMLRYISPEQAVVWAVPPGYADHFARLSPPPVLTIFSEPEAVVSSFPLDQREFKKWISAAPPGTVHLSGRRLRRGEQIKNCLADLHNVNYDLVPSAYFSMYTQAVYQVTRGCPYHCPFCLWGGSTCTDRTFRIRPAQIVADDLNSLRRRTPKHLIGMYLLAAQLTTNKAWLEQFCKLMEGNPYPYKSNVNLSELTPEKIDLLKRSGMIDAAAGLEAITPRTLKMLGKPHTFEQALAGIQMLEDAKMPYRMHIRCGYGENDKDVTEAIIALHKLADIMTIGQIDLGQIVHYRGTEIIDAADYTLVDHANYGVSCPVMRDVPTTWIQFVKEAVRLGLMHKRGLKGWDSQWQRQFKIANKMAKKQRR